jgi:hypothetical protein
VRFEVFTAGAVEVTVRRNVTDTVQFVTNVPMSQRNKLIHKRVAISAEMSITCYYSMWLYKPEISSLTILLISIIRIHHLAIYVLVCQIQSSVKTIPTANLHTIGCTVATCFTNSNRLDFIIVIVFYFRTNY